MFLVNSHIIKMAAMLKPNAEYNRRAAIIEGLRAGRSATEIIRFFGYPRSTVHDVVVKYPASEQSNEDSNLNPMDYYVWSVVERVTNKSRHPNVTSLRTAIQAAFVGMDSATLQRACERFRQRIETVIQANGRYIE
ncbi:hypothetical protein ALC57_12218 [Trachymyrmex cornetzi]|uniref:Mos1 transposase HTH domain-containing protein n=1 Tax=Trachymyrmex cornetzi TaxID=471704 RepID=A0A151J1C4_9HYME|nr:hypothetical protein ALC57_12218 [Trachymyrmex cornetzi]